MGVAAGGTPDLRMAAPIMFLLFKCSNLTMNHAAPDASCTANSVSASGLAACTLPSLSFDNWTAIVQLGTVASPGNTDFAAPRSDLVVATVYQPTSDKFAAGGGFVIDPSYQNKPVAIFTQNNHGHFGFNVRYKSATTPSGQLVYTFRRADGYDYIVKSNSWQGPGLAFGTNTAGFNGKCGVAVIDPRTGQIVTGLGDRNLNGANLSVANLTGANLLGANLNKASLTDANLTGANLSAANLNDARVTGVIWSNTVCPDGSNSDHAEGSCAGRP